MIPINYLRGVIKREPGPPRPVPEPKQPREIPWANPVHTAGACTHDVIYSSCNCPDTNIRTQTNAAD